MRVPFVVRWPSKLPKGTTSTAMINLIDIFATLVELVDGKPPATEDVAPDSVSFYQALLHPEQASETPRSEMIVTNAEGIFAMRQGPWKYIEGQLPQTWKGQHKGTYQGQAVRQLYHLGNDPGEQHNVIEAHPQIAEQMQKRLNTVRK